MPTRSPSQGWTGWSDPPDDVHRDHVGIRRQRQDGYNTASIAVLRGRITAEQVLRVADLADRYASGELRTTNMQNLVVLNVPDRNVDALAREVEAAGLRLRASPFWRGAIACTGTEFCKLAITETKGFAQWLVEELEKRLPGFEQHLKLHVTGCPNSCGQHWIADLGIEGKKMKVGGRPVDAYYFCVGGAVGKHQAIARPVGYRCPADEVPDATSGSSGPTCASARMRRTFRQLCARHRDEELRTFLAGADVESVARDPSPGGPPHGVEG